MNNTNEFQSFPLTGDEADIAYVSTENDLKMALMRSKADSERNKLPPTGYCHFCDYPLENDKGIFCPIDEDFSCAQEYHKEKEANKRNNG